jgi:DNA modification methylase
VGADVLVTAGGSIFWELLTGDVLVGLRRIPTGFVQSIITSPPYWALRKYPGVGPTEFSDGWCILGEEATPEQFVGHIIEIAREFRRVLRHDGTLWLNFGHAYIGGTVPRAPGWRDKCLCPLPWLVGIALIRDGWILRSDNIWGKRSSKPSPVRDRPAICHEYMTAYSVNPTYFTDDDAVRKPYAAASLERRKYQDTDVGPRIVQHQPKRRSAVGMQDPGLRGGAVRHKDYPPNPQGRRIRTVEAHDPDEETGAGGPVVWTLPGAQYPDAHTATFPRELVRDPIRLSTSEAGACFECGAPLRRVTRGGAPLADVQKASGGDAAGGYSGRARKDYDRAERPGDVKARALASMREIVLVGWAPTCGCNSFGGAGILKPWEVGSLRAKGLIRPCIVLDPFSGVATTGDEALFQGRSYFGIDAAETYTKLGEARLRARSMDLAKRGLPVKGRAVAI